MKTNQDKLRDAIEEILPKESAHYYTDKLLTLFLKESKQREKELMERVDREVIGKDETTRTWHRFFKGTSFEKSNSKLSIYVKCAYTNGYNFAKEEQRQKLQALKKEGQEK